jgi:hypothetical protein
MSASYWDQVISDGLTVPSDRPLGDLTADLTRMLGSPDPGERDGTAYPTLTTWIRRGVYDDLLPGLGDGMAAGLRVGLGGPEDDSVFRRAFSVRVLTECVHRDNDRALVPRDTVFAWGDRIATWYLRELDVRAHVAGKGWAHAVAHGADAVGALAGSPHFVAPELTVLLDVLADRVLLPVDGVFCHGELDRMARATMAVLRRDVLPLSVLEPWVRRLSAAATATFPSGALPAEDGTDPGGEPGGEPTGDDPFTRTGHPEAFLRALHLQLALAGAAPAVRPDLLLVLVDALRATNRHHLRPR